MAGYPKIWTRLRHEPWFRPLKAVQKCIWYEVIMIAKEQTDDGWVCFKNVSHFASEVGCDRGSIEEWLSRETGTEREHNGSGTGVERECNGNVSGTFRVSYVEKSRSILRFYLANYNENQQVKRFKDLKKGAIRKGKEKKGKGSKKYEKEIRAILLDLNQKSGKKYRYCESNIDIINPRLNEGRSVNDFKHINMVKCASWVGDPEMEEYLRPETLYCKKHFESYLNERPAKQIEATEKWSKTAKCPECNNLGPVVGWPQQIPEAKKATGKDPIWEINPTSMQCSKCEHKWNL